MDGTAFVTEVRGAFYCDPSDKATISPKRMSKRELFAFAVDKAIIPKDAGLGDYTFPVLRQKLQHWVDENRCQIPHGDENPSVEGQDASENAITRKESRHKQTAHTF